MESIGNGKKKKKPGKTRKNELIQIRIPVAKAGSKKYTHVDWEELLRNNGKAKDEDDLRRFYDEDTLFMAKKLRETKNKSGKKIRVNLDEIQHMNRNCGYDMDDDFIDDTEALDTAMFTSRRGGFYVGKGDVRDMNDDDVEDEEDEDDTDSEDVTNTVVAEQIRKSSSKSHNKKTKEKLESVTSSESESEPVRMTGAPPSIRMAGTSSIKKTVLLKRPSTPPGIRPGENAGSSSDKAEKSEKNPVEKRKNPIISGTDAAEKEQPPAKKKAPTEPLPLPSLPMISTLQTITGSGTLTGPTATPLDLKPALSQTGSPVKGVQSSSTKGSTVTMLAKKICKQQEELNKQKSSIISSVSSTVSTVPVNASATTVNVKPSESPLAKEVAKGDKEPLIKKVTNIFAMLTKTGKLYQEKKQKVFDEETLRDIMKFIDVMKHHNVEKINMEPLIYQLANSFGMTSQEVMRQVEKRLKETTSHSSKKPSTSASIQAAPMPSKSSDRPSSPVTAENQIDLKLTQADLPFLGEKDIQQLNINVNSWRNKKQVPNSVLTNWLKEVNNDRMNGDQARNKFVEYVHSLPDLENPSQTDSGFELPKHERARKPRMFLHQWVYLSRKYVQMILPSLKKAPPTDGFAKKQVIAVNALKEAVKKQMSLFENRKDRHPEVSAYTFQFTDPVLAAISPYLEELCDYSLSVGKLSVIIAGIDCLHQSVSEKITLIQFYIELFRRFQKLSFLTAEEPMKSRLKDAGEQIIKHQVVQNPKYLIKWPDGQEPSLRGLSKELTDFEKSVLADWKSSSSKPSPSPSKPLVKPLRPSTSTSLQIAGQQPSTSSASTPSASMAMMSLSSSSLKNSEEASKRLQAMNQLTQVYLGKYLLATGNSPAIISDANLCPMDDKMLLIMITAVYSCGTQLADQMAMLKSMLTHVGQIRMAKAIADQRAQTKGKLELSEYGLLFDYFMNFEKALEQRKQKKDEAEKQRKMEEKLKKEKEKLMEKERMEARKREEKERKEQEKMEERERKEREKREEKERKEREMREMVERKRKEEEDRIEAKRRIAQELEEQTRKKEAEEAARKELERRQKLETEAANALQGLEEDLLMDDIEFISEQQSRVDEERKIAEAKRAVERENQIKLMRAQQLQKLKEDASEPPSMNKKHEHAPPAREEAQYHEQLNHFQSESVMKPSNGRQSFESRPTVKHEPADTSFDILNAAHEAAGLPAARDSHHHIKTELLEPEKPMSAFEKLASLRGRTMSADMKRGGDYAGGHKSENPQTHQTVMSSVPNPSSVPQNSQYHAPSSATCSSYQNFFPSDSMRQLSQQQHTPNPMSHTTTQSRLQHHQNTQNIPTSQNLQNPQNPLGFQNYQNSNQSSRSQQYYQNQNHNQIPITSSSVGPAHHYNYNSQERSPAAGVIEPNRRSMSISHHQQSPLQAPPQQPQFPISSYQSPNHHNSSIMHTPLSNSSMVSQSPQFSSHPSPMSQQFHTPPSIGMLTNPMVASPMGQPNPSPLQHFNYPPPPPSLPSTSFSPQRPQQMPQRNQSQQNLMHQHHQNHQNHQNMPQTFSSSHSHPQMMHQQMSTSYHNQNHH